MNSAPENASPLQGAENVAHELTVRMAWDRIEVLETFVRKVSEYSNDGWLAREALALIDG